MGDIVFVMYMTVHEIPKNNFSTKFTFHLSHITDIISYKPCVLRAASFLSTLSWSFHGRLVIMFMILVSFNYHVGICISHVCILVIPQCYTVNIINMTLNVFIAEGDHMVTNLASKQKFPTVGINLKYF